MPLPRRTALLLALMLVSACKGTEKTVDATRAAAAAPARDTALAALVPPSASVDVARLVMDPARDPLPKDSALAARIRLGFNVVRETGRFAPKYAGNGLSCANCHLNAGQREGALPLIGVAAVFPQYSGRAGRLITLEDRIRGCFDRSMNGTAPGYDSEELLAVSAYLAWISTGTGMGKSPPWRGRDAIPRDSQVAVDRLDVAHGAAVFGRVCAACHGADGQGLDVGGIRPGPLWGPRSWNDGAGMARIYTAAAFIRHAMPLSSPGTLSDAEAQDVAAYINAQPRPSFARKQHDYPRGGVPVDAVYYPQRYASNPLAPRLPH